MTSISQAQIASPAWGAPRPLAASQAADGAGARAQQHLRPRRRLPSELWAGIALALGWVALWAFFLVAIAHPGAQLHASSTAAAAPPTAVVQAGSAR